MNQAGSKGVVDSYVQEEQAHHVGRLADSGKELLSSLSKLALVMILIVGSLWTTSVGSGSTGAGGSSRGGGGVGVGPTGSKRTEAEIDSSRIFKVILPPINIVQTALEVADGTVHGLPPSPSPSKQLSSAPPPLTSSLSPASTSKPGPTDAPPPAPTAADPRTPQQESPEQELPPGLALTTAPPSNPEWGTYCGLALNLTFGAEIAEIIRPDCGAHMHVSIEGDSGSAFWRRGEPRRMIRPAYKTLIDLMTVEGKGSSKKETQPVPVPVLPKKNGKKVALRLPPEMKVDPPSTIPDDILRDIATYVYVESRVGGVTGPNLNQENSSVTKKEVPPQSKASSGSESPSPAPSNANSNFWTWSRQVQSKVNLKPFIAAKRRLPFFPYFSFRKQFDRSLLDKQREGKPENFTLPEGTLETKPVEDMEFRFQAKLAGYGLTQDNMFYDSPPTSLFYVPDDLQSSVYDIQTAVGSKRVNPATNLVDDQLQRRRAIYFATPWLQSPIVEDFFRTNRSVDSRGAMEEIPIPQERELEVPVEDQQQQVDTNNSTQQSNSTSSTTVPPPRRNLTITDDGDPDALNLPFFTRYAQRKIAMSQALPTSGPNTTCDKVRIFLTQNLNELGLGGGILLASHALAHAMVMNRLLVFYPQWSRWTGTNGSSPCNRRGWECFFLPPSPCTFVRDIKFNMVTWALRKEFAKVKPTMWVRSQDLDSYRILFRAGIRSPDTPLHLMPDLLPPGISRAVFEQVTGESYFQWCQKQLVRYLLRGLQPWAEVMILNQMQSSGFQDWDENNFIIAAHFRNGEALKDKEMQGWMGCQRLDQALGLFIVESIYQTVSPYVTVGEGALDKARSSTEDGKLQSKPRSIKFFFSYDVPTIKEDAKQFWGPESDLPDLILTAKFPTFNMSRDSAASDARVTMAKIFGTEHVMKVSLVNLYLSVAADAWSNNDSSNWGRIINALRFTMGDGHHRSPYVDTMRLAQDKSRLRLTRAFCNVQQNEPHVILGFGPENLRRLEEGSGAKAGAKWEHFASAIAEEYRWSRNQTRP